MILFVADAFAADLTVDVVNGGLSRACTILGARGGVPVMYEGVPFDVEGLHYTLRSDGVGVRLVEREFRFSYPSTATPQGALEAAVTAWNGGPGAYATYHVTASDGVLHVVPDRRQTKEGLEAYPPVLDTVLTMPTTTGSATELLHLWAQTLGRTLGQPVADDTDMYRIEGDDQGPITLAAKTASARALLDDLVGQAGSVNAWAFRSLVPNGAERGGWKIMTDRVDATDEAVLNRTPLTTPIPVGPGTTFEQALQEDRE